MMIMTERKWKLVAVWFFCPILMFVLGRIIFEECLGEVNAKPIDRKNRATIILGGGRPTEKPAEVVVPVIVPVVPVQTYKEHWVKCTGYCPCARCCDTANNKTAGGVWAGGRGIASDWKAFPLWSEIYVPGYGWSTVDDSGGAMRQDFRKGVLHIDVRFKTHREAVNWGIKWLTVYTKE